MRVGIDAREAFRSEPRGIGSYVQGVLRELPAVAPGDEFLLYHQLPRPAALTLGPNLRPVRADMPGGRFHLWERVQMPWRIRRDRLDVYHGTFNTLPPRWRAWPAAPMVLTLHDVIVTWWPDDLDDPFVRYARAVTPRVLRDAALVLTISEWSRKDVCARFGCDPARIRVVHNGLNADMLGGAPPGAGEQARARFAEGRPYLFAIGGALERKNTGRLLEAWGHVRRQRPDWPHLLLVSGLGKATDRFRERAAAAGALDHVRFLPYLSQPDLIATYAGAALSVYPSLVEGWGLPVCESLALGTPVLTSNTSAMPEAGGEHARYFDPASAEAMAAALIDAVERWAPQWPGVREAAMRRARSFTWRATAERVLAAYRDAAAQR
jgi:glycosyltransferase involved in cell wall biosynthesis